jgi:hypothetical protein
LEEDEEGSRGFKGVRSGDVAAVNAAWLPAWSTLSSMLSYVYTDRWAMVRKPPSYPRLASSFGARILLNGEGSVGIS